MTTLSPSTRKCKLCLIPILSRSFLVLIVSFVFLLMLINVPSILSQIFFSICITSKLCRNMQDDQYGNSKKILRFVQFNSATPRFLLFFPQPLPKLFAATCTNCSRISSPDNSFGAILSSTRPSNLADSVLHA
ncbi:hypothetical protein CIPAW_14G084500 [Carya illinoinensis]|uniref:Uncharacterized protein n=1 Tax=Carya illinoinensis TaxID=32201 RepID=A0A8T1NCC2_CARIL|nr:hypothetical protein CIPAW_14G084500 [Carya illinoinensis]